jgi:RsmE family RNA methyltransferase
VNLILFEETEIERPLSRDDPRAVHLLQVLRRQVGDAFDAGLINGSKGKGRVVRISENEVTLEFSWTSRASPPDRIVVLIGLPRPQTARKILQEATSLGVKALHFFRSDKGEANYAQSTLWSSGEWKRHLIAGAEQAFDTVLPEITYGLSLAEALGRIQTVDTRVALDNYEASSRLSQCPLTGELVLAFGPERGWSAGERDVLRKNSFILAHLGTRVLRSETAVTAALAIAKAARGLL